MKKSLAIISAALILLVSCSGNTEKKDAAAVVEEAIAAMPAATADVLEAAMAPLAAASPASVEILASMLQPAGNGCNSKIEYALSGLSRYASANTKVKSRVKKGFENAIDAQADPFNKAFLEAELRLLGEAPAPEKPAPSRRLKASEVLAAMLSDSRSERVRALNAAPACKCFYKKLVNAEKAEGADADILYFLGENRASGQIDYVISQIGGPFSSDAETAAARIGGPKAAAALADVASPALLFFDGDFSDELAAAFDKADAETKAALVAIASRRHMTFMFGRAVECGCYDALSGLATKDDCAALASLLDSCREAEVAPVSAAYIKAASESEDMYAVVADAFASAANPSRFYNALAATERNEAVESLAAAYREGAQEALAAIASMNCRKAADVLLEASETDESHISRFVDITEATRQKGPSDVPGYEDYKVFCKYMTALGLAASKDAKAKVLQAMGNLSLPRVIEVEAGFFEDSDLARTAALAAKKVLVSCSREIDHAALLEYAAAIRKILLSTGYADDGYAADEINLVVDRHAVYPVAELSEEEKAQGFEMLFDGTSLDKWTGDKNGYRIVNNVISTTADYGLSTGNLYTAEEHRDFIYRFEFSFLAPGVNSGVGIRTPMGVDAAYFGMCECQILDHDCPIYGGLNEYQVHGSAYGIIPAKRVVHKPVGEWNTEEIEVRGNHIKVTLNGEVITDGDLAEACEGHNVAPDGGETNPFTKDHRNHPGMFNEKGYISFCGHGKGLQFRNIRILDL